MQEGGTDISREKKGRPRPGIAEVANAAQVSTATVDRVLNDRGGVREATISRVLKAATELGYVQESLKSGIVQTQPKNLIFLLPAGTNPYLRQLSALIRSEDSIAPAFNVRCTSHFVKGFDPIALAEAINHYSAKGDGLAVLGIEHPVVRESINQVSKKGTPVVTIISDVSHCDRASFVGLDNRAVGRTAAYLLLRFCGGREGEVALIAGSLSYLAHNEREMGFLSLMEESFPRPKITGVREGHDDFAENYNLTVALLEQHPDLIGIYNIGGSSGGVARALSESDKANSIVFIGHGLSDDTRSLLIEGTMDVVISQDPLAIIHNVCQIFSNIRRGLSPNYRVPESAMRIIFKENLPLR